MTRSSGSADYLFQKIASGMPPQLSLDGNKKIEARKWLRRESEKITQVNAVRFLSSADKERYVSIVSKNNIGQMFMFWYDAKLKKELPYWDRLPLIFPIEIYPDGFLGINLHYLPLAYRARLMDALYTASTTGNDDKKRLLITYNILKSASKYRYFKPCIKRYLSGHVNSRFVRINPDEWDMCLMLPTERFQKKKKQYVWNESINKIKSTGTP